MNMNLFDLNGKVAVVTGGNGGIGLGIIRTFSQAGARIVIAARNKKKSQQALQELRKTSADAISINVDVANKDSVETLVESTVNQFGRLDILVNNAGINVRKMAQDLSLDDWSRVLEINLTGAFLCSKAAYPAMKASGGGKIINIGSMMSIFGAPLAPAYCASKGGIVQLTKSLAAAWASDNIQVNALLPGWIDTDMTRQARLDIPPLHENVLRRTPAGRWGSEVDCGGTAMFLASPASDFVTGASIPVDGGFSILGT
tara:strand:+ start:259 stop:1032 length:774 start_codon:yes stop_codon:yes gene_type:complete